MPDMVLNTIVPFATRLADDGAVHVRAWEGPNGPVVLVAEMDWAVMVVDRADAYFGPGVFTYPDYALGAALATCSAHGLTDPTIVVRLPDPPGERLLLVADPDDPDGWSPIGAAAMADLTGGADVTGPPPGAYIRRVVEAWVRDGSLPG
jgi:hypothetical protein